jgi:hypothetical protein
MSDCDICSNEDYDNTGHTHADFECANCGARICQNHSIMLDGESLCEVCFEQVDRQLQKDRQ